ncbi:MAG: C25 family cysteine peptidase, partial [Bacteroidota bacterium]
LVGHGLTYTQYRSYESTVGVETLNMIPTFGQPASDWLLASTPDNPIPQTPIGRIAAISGNEVGIYLKKMKEYESAQAFSSNLSADKAWMKNVVHVVGSSDEQLGTMLTDYMNKYRAIMADTSFGANVSTFNKSSTNPVEQVGSSQIPVLFQQGISLLLYFGHSSSTALAFNLEDPKNYNNPGKYPVMIMLGCNAGNFFNYNAGRFTTQISISENFIFTPNRGSIAYFASTHLGIVHYLDIYNTRTYTAISNTQYGKTFGEQIVEAIKQVYNLTTTEDYYARFHLEENTLHGDPALRINAQPKPDYVIEDPFVRILPSFISVSKSTFKVNAKFLNLGKAVNKNIVAEVKRKYPNGVTEVVYRDTIPGIRYADSISIDLPIVATRDRGTNEITVTIDADNNVDELFENNNSITKEITIYDDDASPIYPYNYAIINKQNITFAASTADPFAALEQYKIEIDTTDLFNSSSKISQTISSKGGLLEFKPAISFTDSTVYYWRVSPVVSSGEPKWSESSFIYLQNSDLGFNQSHYFQQLNSTTSRMRIDSATRSWKFNPASTQLAAGNTVYPTGGTAELDFSVLTNETFEVSGGGCSYDEVIINVLNPDTFKPWANDYSGSTGLYNSLKSTCGGHRGNNFEYVVNNSTGRKNAMDFLDLIPDGYYVVIKSNSSPTDPGNTYPPVWKADESLFGVGNTLYHRLYNQGFADIDSFNRPRAWAFVYKKNDATTFPAKSGFTNGIYDKMNLVTYCPTPDTLGYITSPAFGPAKAWKQLKWRGTSVPDATPGDRAAIDLIGVDASNNETVLFSNIDFSQQDYDISTIDPKQYPFVKMRMRNADSINFTPYQMRYWRLTYDPVPEGAIAPNIYLQTKDTVDVGEPFDFRVAFKNVSDAAFDSIKVKMTVTDHNNVATILPVPRFKPLKMDSTINVGYTIGTASFPGLNTLHIDINPDNDQPEQYHFNNFAFREFYVKPDLLNPLMDVTFDGVHILNHDIVSAKPSIVIKLKDEAKWMILDDTSLATVQLRYPDGSLRTFNFNSDTLKFTAAGQAPNPDNTASIEFLPNLLQDGEYELIVSGKDKSNNVSGKMQYRIS